MEKPLILTLIEAIVLLPKFLIFKVGAASVAYPIFFLLYFFEAILFAGKQNWHINIVLAPLRLLLSLIPPLVYVVLPSMIAWAFYLLILETNS